MHAHPDCKSPPSNSHAHRSHLSMRLATGCKSSSEYLLAFSNGSFHTVLIPVHILATHIMAAAILDGL